MLKLTHFHKYKLQIFLPPYCNHHHHPLQIIWSMCITEQISTACFNASPYSTVLNLYKYLHSRIESTGTTPIQVKNCKCN